MKKLFILALSLTMCCGALGLAACKKDDPAPAPQSSNSVPTSESSSQTSSELSSQSSILSESSDSSSDQANSTGVIE